MGGQKVWYDDTIISLLACVEICLSSGLDCHAFATTYVPEQRAMQGRSDVQLTEKQVSGKLYRLGETYGTDHSSLLQKGISCMKNLPTDMRTAIQEQVKAYQQANKSMPKQGPKLPPTTSDGTQNIESEVAVLGGQVMYEPQLSASTRQMQHDVGNATD